MLDLRYSLLWYAHHSLHLLILVFLEILIIFTTARYYTNVKRRYGHSIGAGTTGISKANGGCCRSYFSLRYDLPKSWSATTILVLFLTTFFTITNVLIHTTQGTNFFF